MKHPMICISILAALVAAPGAARASAHDDALDTVSGGLANFAEAIGLESWYDGWFSDANYKPSACTAVLTAGKKAGLKADDVLTGSFQFHPKRQASARGSDWWEIRFGDAPWICEEYARQFTLQQALAPVRAAAEFLDGKSAPTADDARGYNTGAGEGTAERGRDCLKAVDAAIKGGVDGASKVKIAGVEITLSQAKQTYCQAEIDYGVAFEVFITEAQAAVRAEKAAKYEAAGVAGAKLELFIEYDDVYWRGKGCEIIDDVAVLAKAKKLFQWLENSDGTHTIRTYTFKGNKVKSVKNKTYLTEAKAYKGCK